MSVDMIMDARRRVLTGEDLDKLTLMALSNLSEEYALYMVAAANEIRRFYKSDEIEACALSNIKSGNCSEDCKFCSQSAHYKTDAPIYPQIKVEEIVSQALEAERQGATEFCMVSSGWGATAEAEFEAVLEAVRQIRQKTNLFVDCSLGFLTPEQVKSLKQAGLYRNNHNLEASQNYFEKICTTHRFDQRVSHIEMVRHYGIHPCSGGILGMGESIEDRVDLMLSLRSLGADCVPINILNPRPGTPLGDVQNLKPLEIIKYIAIFRMALPKSTIKIAGGREVNLRDLQALAMAAGANGLILGNYLTTMGRNPQSDIQMLKDLGFSVVDSKSTASKKSLTTSSCQSSGCACSSN